MVSWLLVGSRLCSDATVTQYEYQVIVALGYTLLWSTHGAVFQ
jgi:hypothetical protein